jgi:fluoride ion exporter CrcB/FEX
MLKTTDYEPMAISIAISLLLTLLATWLGWRLIRKSPPPHSGVH